MSEMESPYLPAQIPTAEGHRRAKHRHDDAVRDVAYYLWVDCGRPTGRSQELWWVASGAVERGDGSNDE